MLTAVTFSLFGFIIGLWADGFQKLQIIPLMVVTPLTFLGGAFYSINMLPPLWQKIALFNPVVYLISGFRWSFYGVADVNVVVSVGGDARLPRAVPRRGVVDLQDRLQAETLSAVNFCLSPPLQGRVGWGWCSVRALLALPKPTRVRAFSARIPASGSLSLACPRESNPREGHPNNGALRVRGRRPGFADGTSVCRRRTRTHPARAPSGFTVRRPPPLQGDPGKAARSCAQKQKQSDSPEDGLIL